MEYWQKYIVENLFRPISFVLLNIVALPVLTAFNLFLQGFGLGTATRVYACGFIWVLGALTWGYYYLRLPRNKKGSIGIVVSLYCESKEQEIRLKNDVLRKLKLKLAGLEGIRCHFICLPNHKAEKIIHADKPGELCIEWNKKIGGHYFLHGSISQRGGEESKYIVDLAGMVTHAPVPLEVSNAIQIDFNSILPNTVSFKEAFELDGFTLTAEIVSYSVKFIVGIAAMVSRDVFLAHKLHTDLLKDVDGIPKEITIRWKERLYKFIADEENFIAIYYHKIGELDNSKKWIAQLLQKSPRHYGAWLLRAIHDFTDGRTNDAINSVKQARQYSRRTQEWKYSMAFLCFWQGSYDDALSVCYSIQKGDYPGEDITTSEVVEFVEAQIKAHPEKTVLYYWLGFVQYKKLENLPRSLVSFESFLAAGEKNMRKMREKAEGYLGEIKQRGGWL